MRCSVTLAAILISVCHFSWAGAGDASAQRGEAARHANCCATSPCCPDDYCKKPMPCITRPTWCGTDDYCKKPMPCIASPQSCGCVDDYCKKSFPNLCLPRNWQFYRCLSSDRPGPVEAKPPADPKPAPSRPKPLPPTK